MNITMKTVEGKCDLKCAFAYRYANSNSTGKNEGVFLSLSYDSSSVPPVSYNQETYTVAKVMLISPSLHLFDGQPASAEVVVEHTPVKGGKLLKVCMPCISSTDTSTASSTLTQIIQKMATNAPSEGDSTNLNVDFSLQSIVPKKPFFTYTTDADDYIVFGVMDAIPLTSDTISTLQQIVQPFPLPMPSAPLFYNAKGPMSGLNIGDGLYISCQPTGSSEEETDVTYTKNSSSVDFSNIVNSPLFRNFLILVGGCILFIVLFYGVNTFYNMLSAPKKAVSYSLPIPHFEDQIVF